jgi:hypothetical protein
MIFAIPDQMSTPGRFPGDVDRQLSKRFHKAPSKVGFELPNQRVQAFLGQ